METCFMKRKSFSKYLITGLFLVTIATCRINAQSSPTFLHVELIAIKELKNHCWVCKFIDENKKKYLVLYHNFYDKNKFPLKKGNRYDLSLKRLETYSYIRKDSILRIMGHIHGIDELNDTATIAIPNNFNSNPHKFDYMGNMLNRNKVYWYIEENRPLE